MPIGIRHQFPGVSCKIPVKTYRLYCIGCNRLVQLIRLERSRYNSLVLTFGLEHITRITSAMTSKTAMIDLAVSRPPPPQIAATTYHFHHLNYNLLDLPHNAHVTQTVALRLEQDWAWRVAMAAPATPAPSTDLKDCYHRLLCTCDVHRNNSSSAATHA